MKSYYMSTNLFYILLVIVGISIQSITFSGSKIEVGIDEQLGSNIPLDIHFKFLPRFYNCLLWLHYNKYKKDCCK